MRMTIVAIVIALALIFVVNRVVAIGLNLGHATSWSLDGQQ